MKKLIFIGAGGYFLELYEYVSSDIRTGHLNNIKIKGVLDDQTPSEQLDTKYLGAINDYKICEDDIFIICIGKVSSRQRIFEYLCDKDATFLTYVHSTALVSQSATIGKGVVICPFAIVNARAIVSDNVSINVNVSVGHESHVGKHCVLSPYSALNGAASIDDMVFLGTRSTIFPNIQVCESSIIDSHTAVRCNIAAKQIVSQKAPFTSVFNRFLR